ncbi:MAG: hypothetical protein ACI4AM_03445 [Muribaculaceae bacterium]
MKHSILLGALALLTACGSTHKAVESHSVEKYHQQVEARVRVTDSLSSRRVLVLDSPLIEIELPADSVSPSRKVRIAARRAALAEEATATTVVSSDSASVTQTDSKAATKQTASRSSRPWLFIAVLLAAIFLLRKFR